MTLQLKYQQENRYFAQVQKGLEAIASEELKDLGATEVKTIYCGVYFSASQKTLYTITLCSRISNRILAPVISFPAYSEKKLYNNCKKLIKWDQLLSLKQSFYIICNTSQSRIHHSRYASQLMKDAIVDYFTEKFSKRPSLDKTSPDIIFNLFIDKNIAVISLDVGGGSLHKRNYRKMSVPAPLIETTAAAIIRYSQWNGDSKIIDPMCGSGTIISEAFMKYHKIPPSFLKTKNSLKVLPDYAPKLFDEIHSNLLKSRKPSTSNLFFASDHDSEAIQAAKINFQQIDQKHAITVLNKNYLDFNDLSGYTIISNLPYGKRISINNSFYKDFGDFLKHKCKGATVWLLCGNIELVKSIGLRTSKKIPIFNGSLETRLIKLEIY